jgi:hypothetical protein
MKILTAPEFLALAIVGVLVGCDGQAAEVTSKIELDAYERYLTAQAEARYRPTDTPIKASVLETSITVCQQHTEINRKWICHAYTEVR